MASRFAAGLLAVTAMVPVGLGLSIPTAGADEDLTLPLAEADAWARLERAIAAENAGLWADAIDAYLAMVADVRAVGGEKQYLLLNPPEGLATQVAGCLRLFPFLAQAQVDVVSAGQDADEATMARVDAANEDACRRFLVACGVDPVGPELKAAAKALLAALPGVTEGQALGAAQDKRATGLLRERYELDGCLLRACDLARAHEVGGKVALVRALHDATVHVGVETYVARRLGDLPAAGRAVYQERLGAPARAKLAAAGQDRRQLLELVRDYRALPVTALALDRLALLELEAGDALGAIDHWKRLEAETPHQDALPSAALLARHAHAHASVGEVEGVEQLLAIAEARPVATLRIAGEDRTLTGVIAAYVVLARERAARRLLEFNAPGDVAWELEYRRQFGARARLGEGYPVEYLPVVDESTGLFYLRTQSLIRAYELASGKFRAEARPALIQGERGGTSLPRTGEAAVASEGFHALCVGGRYLASMTDLRVGEDEERETALPTTSLLCYDRELALSWRRPNPDGDDDALLGRALIGSVLATDGTTVYAGVTVFSGDVTSHVYAFDLATGVTRWRRFLCGRPQGPVLRYPSAAVACGGSTVYVATGMGCAAALDAASGEVRWLSRYHDLPEPLRGKRVAPVHENRWWLAAPLVLGGRVVFAPTDAPDLLVLNSATGRERQSYPHADNAYLRYCLGLDEGGRLVLGGRQVHVLGERGVADGADKRRNRQIAVATLVYDDNDRDEQFSRWTLEGATEDASSEGSLFAAVAHSGGRTTVSLYKNKNAGDADRVATGTIQGKRGVVLLGPPAEAKDNARTPLRGLVTIDFKRARGPGDLVEVLIPVGLVAAPVLARGQVLVPTTKGVLRLGNDLEPKAMWGRRELENYALGNLSLARSSAGNLLIVASRERCVAYFDRRP